MKISTLAAAMLLPALFSCCSPLDESTGRIDTQLTNIIKLRTMAVSARLALAADTVIIDDWEYDVASSSLAIDSTMSPATLRLDRRMVHYASETPRIWLKDLRIRLDRTNLDTAVEISGGDPALGNGVAAIMEINGTEYATGSDYTVSAVLHYVRGTKNGITGTMLIGIDRSPAFTLLLAVELDASQD
jgi:hypothetical protein